MIDPRWVATGASLVAALGAVSLVGPVASVAAGLAVASLLGAGAVRQVAGHPVAWGVFGLVAAGLGLAAAATLDVGEVLGVFLAVLGIHRVATRPLLADRVPIAISTLGLLVVAARREDALVLVAAGVQAACLPVALWTVRPRWGPAGSCSLVGTAAALAAFVLAPRLTTAPDADRTGFSEAVQLGALDELLDDPTLAFRARVSPTPRGALVWRGRALDTFDGRTWSAPEDRASVEVVGPRTLPPDAFVVEIEVEKPGQVVFTTGRVVDVRTDGAPLFTDARSGFRAEAARRWRLVTMPPLGVDAEVAWGENAGDLAAAVALPADLDPRVAALARQVAGEGTHREQLERLAEHLRTSYVYTRTPRDRGDPTPLTTFLFDTRAGHCEYFASALAVLGRTLGIPTRVVNGYAGGTVRPDGWLEVRGSNAHAWVEAWLEGAWRGVDATPGPSATTPPTPWSPPLQLRFAGWYDTFLDYGREQQLGWLLLASSWLQGGRVVADQVPWRGALGLAALAVIVLVAVRRVLGRTVPLVLDPPLVRTDPVVRAHDRAREHLAASGLRPPVALPPVAAATWAAEARPGDDTTALLELAWLLYEVRLGGADPRRVAPRAAALADRVSRPDPPPTR